MKKQVGLNCQNEKLDLIFLEKFDTNKFITILENNLKNHFGDFIHENYGRQHPWSLLNLIEKNQIDSYVLLYYCGEFWGGCGGIIRYFGTKKVYQTGFRTFTNTRNINDGLGSKSLLHEHIIKYHIIRAKKLDCTSIVLSFNTYNERLFKITRDYHLKKVFGAWQSSPELVEFNGVQQWLLTMFL